MQGLTHRIMKNDCQWQHPSSRYDEGAHTSVSWACLFLSGGKISQGGRIETYMVTKGTWSQGLWPSLLVPSMPLEKQTHFILVPCIFQTKKGTSLKLCWLFWAVWQQSLSNFSEAYPAALPLAALSPFRQALDVIPGTPATTVSLVPQSAFYIWSSKFC